MTRRHSHRGRMLDAGRRADRLVHRADHYGRRSARAHGVVVSVERMAKLRQLIASGALPDWIRRLGRVGPSTDTYAVDFNGIVLAALYDRRSQSIASFLPIDAPEIPPEESPDRTSTDP